MARIETFEVRRPSIPFERLLLTASLSAIVTVLEKVRVDEGPEGVGEPSSLGSDAPFDLFWLEEPRPSSDVDAYWTVRRANRHTSVHWRERLPHQRPSSADREGEAATS